MTPPDLPKIGQFVFCTFPFDERASTPGPKVRTALVGDVLTDDNGKTSLIVAYCTGRLPEPRPTHAIDVTILRAIDAAGSYDLRGNPTPFRINLLRTKKLDYTPRWFPAMNTTNPARGKLDKRHHHLVKEACNRILDQRLVQDAEAIRLMRNFVREPT
jgi:hypothetical protein